jgi:hypothetical protein
MPEPIKFPAPPLASGQIEVKLGGRRYVLHTVGCACEACVNAADAAVESAETYAPAGPPVFHRNAFVLEWPRLGEEPKP